MTTARGESTRQWLNAILVVLAIPIIAIAISLGVVAKYQGDVYAAVEQEIGRSLTSQERSDPDLEVVSYCAGPQSADDAACADVRLAGSTKVLGIAGSAEGAALLLTVAFLRARASRDRNALLRLFRPGLYVTLIGITLLVALDGLLAVGAVYLGLGVFLGRIYPILILAIAAGALFALVGIVRAMFAASKPAIATVVARRVDATAEPRLVEAVAQLATATGTDGPDNVLVGLDPGFYVSEVETEATDGRYRGRTLYLSLSMSHVLTIDELRAIVGHEMGHFRGADTEWSQRFYPIYAGASGAFVALARAAGGSGGRSIPLIPALMVLSLFMEAFATAERAISRERELAADKVGAAAVSARAVASSLVKVTAFSDCWGETVDTVVSSVRAGTPLGNASETFVELARAAAKPSAMVDLDTREIPHPTDSHPPLSVRLEGLGVSLADVTSDALVVDSAEPASSLIANAGAIEAELTAWLEARIGGQAVVPAPASAA